MLVSRLTSVTGPLCLLSSDPIKVECALSPLSEDARVAQL